jgi:hypothetical protein
MLRLHRDHFEDQPADDPRLDSLLDEALAAEAPPAGLVQGIIAQTAPALRSWRPSVLARLNEYRWPKALAASVVFAAMLGIVLQSFDFVHNARASVLSLAMIRNDLNNLAVYQPPVPPPALQMPELRTLTAQYRSDLDEVQNSLSQAFPEPDPLDDEDSPPVLF